MFQVSLDKINALATDIHADNTNAGWWTDLKTGESLIGKRNIGELLCLTHSELSEGYEGYEKSLMDDKLPHRKMIEVEVADAAIRIYDILGSKGGAKELYIPTYNRLAGMTEWLCVLNREVSRAMEGFRKGKEDVGIQHLVGTLVLIEAFCVAWNYDLAGAIAEKREFNRNRLDHKVENRKQEGGKQF